MLSTAFGIGIWNILFWIFVGMFLGGLLSWLIGGRTESASSIEDRAGLASLEGRTVTVRENLTEVADELQAIEGVGPQIAELFHKNGIYRFHQVAAMSPDDITRILKSGGSRFDIASPFTWPFQAKLLAAGLIGEHFELRERLRAGRLPLTGISGLGAATAERLAAMDIHTVDALADARAADVTAKLNASGDGVVESVVGGWIDHARGIRTGKLEKIAAFFGIPITALTGKPVTTYTSQRDVVGPLVDASGLLGASTATASATSRPSLLPVWLGIGGAILTALLSSLGGPHVPAPQIAGKGVLPSPGNMSAFSAELGTDTTFETNSAVLTNAGKAAVDAQIIDPARDLDVASVRIVGHADVRGDDASNLQLSRDRAQSVADYMRAKVKADNIQWNPRVIEVYGAGEQFPNPAANTVVDCAKLDPSSAEASTCYAPDRRVDVTILAKGAQSAVDAATQQSNANK